MFSHHIICLQRLG